MKMLYFFSPKWMPSAVCASLALLCAAITTAQTNDRQDAERQPPAASSASSAVVDRSAALPKYRIIFSPYSKLDIVSGLNLLDQLKIRQSDALALDASIREMNRAGADGYRLTTASRNYFFCLMRLDEGRYEYRHLETLDDFARWQLDFPARQDVLLRSDFRFAAFYFLDETREIFNPLVSAAPEWAYSTAYLYERELNRRRPAPPQMLIVMPPPAPPSAKRAAAQAAEENALAAQISEKLAARWYPRAAFSPRELLFERAADADEVEAAAEVRVVIERQSADELLERINKLAKEGFQLRLANQKVAVLTRRHADAAAAKGEPEVSYLWVPVRGKKYETKLAKLAEDGGRFWDKYSDGIDDYLLFEKAADDTGAKRRDLRMLILSISSGTVNGEPPNHLTAAGEETVRQFHRLIEEGWQPRTVFNNGPVGAPAILMERER